MEVTASMITAVVGGIWAAILTYGAYLLYVWVRSRISPKYAAQRKLRLKAKSDRAYEARKKKRASGDERLEAWARENPEDPAAKALLAEKDSPSFLATPKNTEPQDLQAVLRQQQLDADELARQMEARKAAKELLNQQLLEWAKANPSTQEGRRLLVETLMEADRTATDADRDIRFAGYFTHEADSPEAIENASRIAEAEARKATAQRTIDDIQATLAALPDNQ
jgi:hypothetical protein